MKPGHVYVADTGLGRIKIGRTQSRYRLHKRMCQLRHGSKSRIPVAFAAKWSAPASAYIEHRAHADARRLVLLDDTAGAAAGEGGISAVKAQAVIRYAKLHGTKHRPWLTALLARRPTKVAAIALANKMARMAWAMMTRGERYKEPVALAA
jgi:T5orf172 domain